MYEQPRRWRLQHLHGPVSGFGGAVSTFGWDPLIATGPSTDHVPIVTIVPRLPFPFPFRIGSGDDDADPGSGVGTATTSSASSSTTEWTGMCTACTATCSPAAPRGRRRRSWARSAR